MSDAAGYRTGPNSTAIDSRQPFSSSSSGPRSGGMSRAERFEDEKKRIIESCFGKKDTDGSRTYSYYASHKTTSTGPFRRASCPSGILLALSFL
jgi:hypothetical protein